MKNKQGVLIVNLGTPSAATPEAIRSYLTEFLLDRHVVDLPAFIWYPILKYLVLPKRVPYIINHYQKIWINDESPLLHYSKRLMNQLQQALPDIQCELAMTYGEPSLQSALNNLKSCEKVTLLPLFPQYSTTTTQAVLDKIKQLIRDCAFKINYIRDYADDESYIDALYSQVQQAFSTQGQPDVLLLSYHGIPQRYIDKRQDDYVQRCQLTTQLLIKKCQDNGIDLPIKMAYQSKFGKGKWVEPNTSDILENLAKTGTKHVHVICPGFSADCIETLHEIDEQNREIFLNAGGKQFYYIPALNDTPLQVELIKNILQKPRSSTFLTN
ncbi:ferrochelatase [Gilliamella sp. B2865]|uniref:ferrochelatase n=1 Tax=unclassified Gilliamella TaxID=2685620 RepID=UPI002269FDE7|nr:MULTISPECIES: ferrochelatase [unclassified Gilliamella]MCX8671601.1 ferrochelatase [Gilliamella sp. B2785]MCX8679913.1 ferrochelatase [Gilliamella sp. B2865]